MSAAKPSLTDFIKNKQAGTSPATLPSVPKAETTAPTKTAAKPANGADEAFFVSSAEIDREWELGLHLVRITEAENYVAESSGNRSFKVRMTGLHGTMKGAGIDDYWPKAGKGLRKTHKAAAAVDLVDADGNISIPGGAQQLVGRELWIEIERVNEKYRDKETGEEKTMPRNKIGFTGYYHKSIQDVPKDGDLFADENAPLPAQGEVVGVEA